MGRHFEVDLDRTSTFNAHGPSGPELRETIMWFMATVQCQSTGRHNPDRRRI